MWQTPKTDWHYEIDSEGVYTGDRFNVADYNRIKHNIIHLHELAINVFPPFDIKEFRPDVTLSDYLFAGAINLMLYNLDLIIEHTFKGNYGPTPSFHDNGRTINAAELNRTEGAILELYNKITDAHKERRNFTWNFGMKGGNF